MIHKVLLQQRQNWCLSEFALDVTNGHHIVYLDAIVYQDLLALKLLYIEYVLQDNLDDYLYVFGSERFKLVLYHSIIFDLEMSFSHLHWILKSFGLRLEHVLFEVKCHPPYFLRVLCCWEDSYNELRLYQGLDDWVYNFHFAFVSVMSDQHGISVHFRQPCSFFKYFH